MIPAASPAIAVAKVLDGVLRSDRGRLLAILASQLRDLALAEEALQEAAIAAMSHWARVGLPASPQGWLLAVARRKAIDRLRAATRDARKVEVFAQLNARSTVSIEDASTERIIPDERLRLIFACCHPALEVKSRVALTLRTVCGLSTREIARAFLDAEPTMGQRLSRAKAKIAAAGIPFAVPGPEDWGPRLDAVLTTLYLIFTTGYVAGRDEARDLCEEALFMVRLVDRLHPADPEIEGALAMMLLTGARRAARVGPDGASLPPGEQDRRLWDMAAVEEGRALLLRAIGRGRPGPFQIKAAIADCQMAEAGPDWLQIAALYRLLWTHEPTPVVSLNGAVAMAEAGDPHGALAVVQRLGETLSDFQPWHAVSADLLARTGQVEAAAAAYRRAIEGATSAADVAFLTKRLARVE